MKKKWIRAESETIHPNLDNLGTYGGRRKEQKTKGRTKKNKQEADPQPSYLDHLVTSYDPHGSYGGLILKPTLPPPTGVYIYIYIS